MLISKAQARFILAAVCKNIVLTSLTSPAVSEVGGQRWICSTDGHRLHAVRCPDQSFPLGWCSVTKDGTVTTIDRAGKPPPIAQVWSPELDSTCSKQDVERLLMVSSGSSDTHVQWDTDRTVPPRVHVHLDPVAESQVGVCAPYVAEALFALPRSGKNAPAFVRFARTGNRDPVLLVEDRDAPTWRAILMPVHLCAPAKR